MVLAVNNDYMNSISISNRNEAYKEILKNLANRQKQVYDCLTQKGPLNSEEIKKHLSLEDKCSVTGRLKELEELCLIVPVSTSEGKTVYQVCTEENSLFLRNARKSEYILELFELEEDLKKNLSSVTISVIKPKISKLKKLISLL
jgi:predicted transcriptional regulator